MWSGLTCAFAELSSELRHDLSITRLKYVINEVGSEQECDLSSTEYLIGLKYCGLDGSRPDVLTQFNFCLKIELWNVGRVEL